MPSVAFAVLSPVSLFRPNSVLPAAPDAPAMCWERAEPEASLDEQCPGPRMLSPDCYSISFFTSGGDYGPQAW